MISYKNVISRPLLLLLLLIIITVIHLSFSSSSEVVKNKLIKAEKHETKDIKNKNSNNDIIHHVVDVKSSSNSNNKYSKENSNNLPNNHRTKFPAKFAKNGIHNLLCVKPYKMKLLYICECTVKSGEHKRIFYKYNSKKVQVICVKSIEKDGVHGMIKFLGMKYIAKMESFKSNNNNNNQKPPTIRKYHSKKHESNKIVRKKGNDNNKKLKEKRSIKSKKKKEQGIRYLSVSNNPQLISYKKKMKEVKSASSSSHLKALKEEENYKNGKLHYQSTLIEHILKEIKELRKEKNRMAQFIKLLLSRGAAAAAAARQKRRYENNNNHHHHSNVDVYAINDKKNKNRNRNHILISGDGGVYGHQNVIHHNHQRDIYANKRLPSGINRNVMVHRIIKNILLPIYKNDNGIKNDKNYKSNQRLVIKYAMRKNKHKNHRRLLSNNNYGRRINYNNGPRKIITSRLSSGTTNQRYNHINNIYGRRIGRGKNHNNNYRLLDDSSSASNYYPPMNSKRVIHIHRIVNNQNNNKNSRGLINYRNGDVSSNFVYNNQFSASKRLYNGDGSGGGNRQRHHYGASAYINYNNNNVRGGGRSGHNNVIIKTGVGFKLKNDYDQKDRFNIMKKYDRYDREYNNNNNNNNNIIRRNNNYQPITLRVEHHFFKDISSSSALHSIARRLRNSKKRKLYQYFNSYEFQPYVNYGGGGHHGDEKRNIHYHFVKKVRPIYEQY